jgi:RNA polymerase sigma-70 factor, ECF subfamily
MIAGIEVPAYTICFPPLTCMSEDFPNPVRRFPRSIDRPSESGDASRSASPDMLLLERIRSKEQAAMADLFDRYGSMIFSVAMRVLRDAGNAEDVMQEVFIQLWENPRMFQAGRGSLGAWLLVVARNRAVDLLRRRRPTDSVDEVVLAAGTDVALEAERNATMEKVRRALDDLPQEQRQSVEMAFFEGLTHSEIAARTGDPLGTVKTRIRSALTGIRKAFQA